MKKELIKTLRKLQDEFHCYDEKELDYLESNEDAWLRDKDCNLESLNFIIDYDSGSKFNCRLTYNGFGDLDIEYVDKLIEQLKRKRKILEELDRFKGINLN